MATLFQIVDWLKGVDLIKWVVTIAIPTSAFWLFNWLAAWRARRAEEKRQRDEFKRFMDGLPRAVRGLIEVFLSEKSHTVRLNSNDETVQLAVGLGVITLVSYHLMDASYRLRDDIWEHFYNNLWRMKKPSEKGTNQEDEI